MSSEPAVPGLQKGAPVVVRGVRIGDVTDVQVHWGTSLVKVYVALDPAVLKGVTPASVDAGIRSAIKERGLRAQLRTQSFVTGVLYVALDDFPGTPVVLRGFDTEVPELPTVPTDIEKWTAKIEKIADALGVLPLDEIGRSVIATLDEARRLLKSPEIASSLKSLDVILAETRGLVQKMDTLATNVNSQVDPLSTDAQAALVSAKAALAQVPALVQDVRRVVAKLEAHAQPLPASLGKASGPAGATRGAGRLRAHGRLERRRGHRSGAGAQLPQSGADRHPRRQRRRRDLDVPPLGRAAGERHRAGAGRRPRDADRHRADRGVSVARPDCPRARLPSGRRGAAVRRRAGPSGHARRALAPRRPGRPGARAQALHDR